MKDYIHFDKSKDFRFIKSLGSGGTGQTILLLDETTNLEFAFKKFRTDDEKSEDDLYRRFVDEIKILLKIYHPNVVRVFDYYLYPEKKTGYIQMEYINGAEINDYRSANSSEIWNSIFIDLINAFSYLESNKILHRDIRSANILVTREGCPKIIDFGFGLAVPQHRNNGTSILLNWPVSQWPAELEETNPSYTSQTEIYFLGKLLKGLELNKCDKFKYSNIVIKMCKYKPTERFTSFEEIGRSILRKDFKLIEFSPYEKEIYKKFVEGLVNILASHINDFNPVNDPDIVINRLSSIVAISGLEDYAQDFRAVIKCFVDNEVSWYTRREFENKKIVDFLEMITGMEQDKKQTVIENIIARLKKVQIEREDDIPF